MSLKSSILLGFDAHGIIYDMNTNNEKKNRIKIWIFGIITLVLIPIAVSLLIPNQRETMDFVDIDGSVIYYPNTNTINYLTGSTIANLIIIPLIIVFLMLTIVYFIKNAHLKKNKKKLSS